MLQATANSLCCHSAVSNCKFAGGGLQVTNYHVIRGASDLQVTLTGGLEVKAKVVGYDEDKDVAVLHIQLSEEQKVMAWLYAPMAVLCFLCCFLTLRWDCGVRPG